MNNINYKGGLWILSNKRKYLIKEANQNLTLRVKLIETMHKNGGVTQRNLVRE